MVLFGERLESLVRSCGKLQKDVELELGIKQRQLNRYYHGEQEPSFTKLTEICRYFGVSADYLLGLTDER